MPQSKKPKPTKSKPNKKEIFKKGRLERMDDKPADGELLIEELGKVVGGHCRGCGGCRDL